MAYKHTMVFDVRTGSAAQKVRVGSWTESVWASTDKTNPHLWALIGARRKLLPKNCAIVGIRVADENKTGGSRVEEREMKGTYPTNSDIPKLCLNIFSNSDSGAKLRYCIRGLPDDMVENGELKDQRDQFNNDLVLFWNALLPFYQKTRDVKATARDIVSITTQGVLRPLTALPGVAAGDGVYVLRPRTLAKGKHGGEYKVTAVSENGDITLNKWNGGNAEGGKVRIKAALVSNYVAPFQIGNVSTREVGKPLFLVAGGR